MKIESWIKFAGVGCLVAGILTGCYNDKSHRNLEYSPNMTNSLPLEPYSQTIVNNTELGGYYPGMPMDGKVAAFKDGRNAQSAPVGTLPRAESWYNGETYQAYPFSNSTDGYDSSGVLWLSPIDNPALNEAGHSCTSESFAAGKKTYEIFCVNCHGAAGDGQGNLVTSGKYAGVPAYNSRPNITGGNMYHALTYGKNIMGSHASQLTPKQRWEVICYIQDFQKQQ